jgi:hypothetical protein
MMPAAASGSVARSRSSARCNGSGSGVRVSRGLTSTGNASDETTSTSTNAAITPDGFQPAASVAAPTTSSASLETTLYAASTMPMARPRSSARNEPPSGVTATEIEYSPAIHHRSACAELTQSAISTRPATSPATNRVSTARRTAPESIRSWSQATFDRANGIPRSVPMLTSDPRLRTSVTWPN